MPINAEDVCRTSKKDPALRNVMKCIRAGPYLNKMFLIIIDSYSKWLEIVPTKADSADTIKKL